MKNFAITGAAGYVAPRHLKAIHETGNRLVAALDPHDSVGQLDRFSFSCQFFTEFERFERHLEKMKRRGSADAVDVLSVCSPNHLHDAHVRLALRAGADAICEKPLVLNPWNLDLLSELEAETGRRVYTVLQLRLHPDLRRIADHLRAAPAGKHVVTLRYVTARGPWYHRSWKGDIEKSGGLATNIGIHFFDLLVWLFGKVLDCGVEFENSEKVGGTLILERADVKWFLSIDISDLPVPAPISGATTFRSITIDGADVEFSSGFENLHTEVYRDILSGNGFGIEDARASVVLAHRIRCAVPKVTAIPSLREFIPAR